jgi:uracil-DNA glycosylase
VSLSREDMLRELELLPVWRARLPAPANLAPVTIATPVPVVEAEVATEATTPVVEPVVETVSEPLEMEASAPIAQTQQTPSEVLPEVEPSLPAVAAEPLVQTPWLLYCPQASDTQSQQLLQNIMRALQLPLEAVSLYQQDLQLAQVNTRFCVLFGLAQANQFLATEYAQMAAVRGQILTYGDMMVVITHHPQAMLENPLLKREVWHDLCLLLAKNTDVAT